MFVLSTYQISRRNLEKTNKKGLERTVLCKINLSRAVRCVVVLIIVKAEKKFAALLLQKLIADDVVAPVVARLRRNEIKTEKNFD
jgi:hypothetical protein